MTTFESFKHIILYFKSFFLQLRFVKETSFKLSKTQSNKHPVSIRSIVGKKLYIPSTINTGYILWQLQLIADVK